MAQLNQAYTQYQQVVYEFHDPSSPSQQHTNFTAQPHYSENAVIDEK